MNTSICTHSYRIENKINLSLYFFPNQYDYNNDNKISDNDNYQTIIYTYTFIIIIINDSFKFF